MDLDGFIRAQIREHAAAVEDGVLRAVVDAFEDGLCAELAIERRWWPARTLIHRCSGDAHHQGRHDFPTVGLLD